MKNTLVSQNIIDELIAKSGITDLGRASIRQIVKLVNDIENQTGVKFVKMEMGVPGVKSSEIGVNAEIDALKSGVASVYPVIDGIPELKNEMSRFVKLFLDISVNPKGCIPTVGSMQGSFMSFMITGRRDKKKNTILFIDPGFPVQKSQIKSLGLKSKSFDVYNYRGEKLREKLEEYFKTGTISSILYSNPNNPSWICFNEDELRIIGELAAKYDVIVIEDLAYFCMDFREDYSKPGKAPFQPTVAKYTDNYILLISSSKAFSYAGQRIATFVVSDKLYNSKFPDLVEYFSTDVFGDALIYGALYVLTSGTSHSSQYALAAMLKGVNDGSYHFVEDIKIYAEKAHRMKTIFLKYGFSLVYDKDIDREIGNGFYFTVMYKDMTGSQLLNNLLNVGVSAITLETTGSEKKNGIRACSSLITFEQIEELDTRLSLFRDIFGN